MASIVRCDVCQAEVVQPSTRGFHVERSSELGIWGQPREWDVCGGYCLHQLGMTLNRDEAPRQATTGPHLKFEERR